MKTYSIMNAPDHELCRSSAAVQVAELSRSSDLFLSHFEHRFHLPLPDTWSPGGQADLVPGPYWEGGHLREHKFRHFRYDNPVGSFNPGHRAKWTAHELCHALVGFAWRPDASPLFHSLTARLAEVLPVALWYFFDEADVNRCRAHSGSGALFGQFCPACEHAAALPPTGPIDEGLIVAGREFVMAELAAIARSKRQGRPVGHRYATLDLTTDSLAWTRSHLPRLNSSGFHWHRELFLGPTQGAFDHLEDLEARVIEVMNAITGEASASPLKGDRWLWMAQDIAWRLITVREDCEGELVNDLEGLVTRLAMSPDEATIAQTSQDYSALCGEWFLPPHEEVFALGYASPCGHGAAVGQIVEGVEQTMPNTTALLGEATTMVIEEFAKSSVPERGPLARRVAQMLTEQAPGATADVASYEAAIAHPAPPDAVSDSLSGPHPRSNEWTAASGVEVLYLKADVSEIINLVDDLPDELPERPHILAIRRASDGDVIVAEISRAAAELVETLREVPGPWTESSLSELEFKSLRDLGLLVPARYSMEQPLTGGA